MSFSINNSYLLQKKLHFISKKHTKICVSNNFLLSRTIKIIMPHFCTATFCTNVKNIPGIIEAKNFDIKNNILEYKILYKDIEIIKKIEIEDELDTFINNIEDAQINVNKKNCLDDFDFVIECEISEFIGKIKNVEKVKLTYENGYTTFLYDENIKVEVRVKSKNINRCKIRSKDLWFLKYAVDDVGVKVCNNFLLFFLYEDESVAIIKVDMVD